MFEQGKLSKACKIAEELLFQRTRYALEVAQIQRVNLENLTQPRVFQVLKSRLIQAQATEHLLEAALKLEKAREETKRRQVAACRIAAPRAGKLVLAPVDSGILTGALVRIDREQSGLEDVLAQQQLAVQKAEAGNLEALSQVDIADQSLREYTQGTFLHGKAQTMVEIKRAEVENVQALQLAEWRRQMFVKGIITASEKTLLVDWYGATSRELHRTNDAMQALVTDEKVKVILQLRADIELCQSEQKAAEAMLELERTREAHLRAKLDRLRQQTATAGKTPAPTELKPGESVYEGQILARIVSEGPQP